MKADIKFIVILRILKGICRLCQQAFQLKNNHLKMAKKNTAAPPPKKAPAPTANKGSFIEKNALRIAIGLGIIGLMMRLYNLGFQSLWVDEYMHALAAQKGQFAHGENNGILLTWINTLLGFVFGTSEFMLRFPVALMGAALIPVIFVFGKRIMNYKVGLMAAMFVMMSLYLIFWSRVDRPYGMVPALYLPLLLCFWLMLEKPSEKNNFLTRMGVNPKYFWFVLLGVILSMLSQLICFLFIFTAGFYGTFMAVDQWITKRSTPLKLNIYNILCYLNILLVFLMFTPAGSKLMHPFIKLFLPENMATFILPDLKNISVHLNGPNWDKCYTTYSGVLKTDFKNLYLLGWAGFVFAFFKSRKLGYFLFSAFVIPFLLMSFIFVNLSHAKYIIYLYPVFLISAAFALYYIAFGLLKFLGKTTFTETNRTYLTLCLFSFLIILFAVSSRKEIGSLLNTQKHGVVIRKELSEISFVNWREPCQFLNEHRQPNDIIMATVQAAPRYYLKLDSVVWFRQMHLNPKWNMNTKTEDRYIPNEPEKKKVSAYTYEQLVKTFNENPRGWLLADYYFDNALTDSRARQFVIENFTFHFEASIDGGVKVFSWDKSKPKAYPTTLFIELGKENSDQMSEEMSFNIDKTRMPPKATVLILGQGIDSDTEAYLLINGKDFAIKSNGRSMDQAPYTIEVDASVFVQGENKFQFAYNESEVNGDINKGFVVLNLDIR